MSPDPLSQLIAIRDGLLAQLVEEAQVTGVDSRADYSLDGESTQREAWRAGTMQRLQDLQQLILSYQPYEIRTYAL